MIYFAIDDDNRIVSFGPEEYPNSIGLNESEFPDSWIDIFNDRHLGFHEGVFFYIPLEHEEVIAE
jgi:hypothetical protein